MFSKLLLTTTILLAVFSTFSNALFNITGRIWVIGGDFTTIYPTEGADGVSSNYLAYWDGEKLGTFGTQPNGIVRTLFMDDCQNLWIGGDFTSVDGVDTGPLAVRRLIDKNVGISNFTSALNAKWESVGNGTSANWGAGAQIYSLSVDCVNLGACECDVHVGGSFSSAAGNAASNVAKWDAGTNTWNTFKGGVDGLVRAVFKSPDYTYVGGDYTQRFSRYSKDGEAWQHYGTDFDGNVYSLVYDSNVIDDDIVYIGGDFSEDVLKFSSQAETIDAVASNINGTVRSVRLNGDNLYLGGDFNNAPIHYVAYYEPGQANFDSISATDSYVKGPAFAVEPCRTTQVGCETGSVFVASAPGTSWSGSAYFNAEDGTWNAVGGGVNGKIHTVNSAYTKSSASSVAISFLFLAAVIFAVISLLL